ncbi:hypothetical protein COT20_02575 [bacterium (Candidatus Gribaldobacteria) CG08_land_8_20_14_0_20_39_15]|uniref:Uncharacterized protein n=1 Tax=bacterium (Candidatus Gribaldobacteria) CG08_land_8_20_14_0_20_39_15 TaxID=2014273 RepID=A0A2M6XTY7_9BACT|nr:MAG: hypothetical protein COT20_02575 [bacterium (Candidatus Gribaldobacteria) CG08_land_8_20_14_0_20_39_15]
MPTWETVFASFTYFFYFLRCFTLSMPYKGQPVYWLASFLAPAPIIGAGAVFSNQDMRVK